MDENLDGGCIGPSFLLCKMRGLTPILAFSEHISHKKGWMWRVNYLRGSFRSMPPITLVYLFVLKMDIIALFKDANITIH